jgi:hypothetical protein
VKNARESGWTGKELAFDPAIPGSLYNKRLSAGTKPGRKKERQQVAHLAQDVLKFTFCAGVAQAGRAADL